MLKKISSLAAGTYEGRRSQSGGAVERRRSLDEGKLVGHGHGTDAGYEGSPNSKEEDLSKGVLQGLRNRPHEADQRHLQNAMEMLIAENKHLKELIQERDSRNKSSDSPSSPREEEVEALREECEELKSKVKRLQRELQSKEEFIESLKRDGALKNTDEGEHLKNKISSLEAQLQFECRSHAEELQEKDARLAELEMQLVDAQQRTLGKPSVPLGDNASVGKSQEISELERKLAAQAAELSQKEGEVKRLQALMDSFQAAQTEKQQPTQPDSAEYLQRIRDLQQRIDILEAKLKEAEEKLAEAEETLLRQSTDTAASANVDKAIDQLRKEIREKDAALQGMSQQLLEVSAEKDELAQELQKLRETPHTPDTPRTLTSKRSFFGRSKSMALERDALAGQVQQLEEQVQQLTEKRVGLERTKVKLEGQLAEATQDVRVARNENAALEEREPGRMFLLALRCLQLKEREAALEALRAAHADMKKPLDAPDNLVLPLPKGRHDIEFEAKSQLVLKDGVIRALSSRIAHLQFALREVTAEKEHLLVEPATIALRQQLEEKARELAETSAKYRDTATQRTQLKEKIKDLSAEVANANREIATLKAALDEAQIRLTTTADKYKQQSDRYRTIVSSSLSRIEELQDEVSRERNSKILVGKVYRQEMLELRKAAVLGGGVRGDPVRPLSCREPERSNKMQQTEDSLQQQDVAPSGRTATPAPAAAQVTAPSSPVFPGSLRLALPPNFGSGSTTAGCCPFSHGIPTTVSGITADAELATIPLSYPLEDTPRQDGTEWGYAERPARANLTDDQRLAKNILHSYVSKQQQEHQKHQDQEQRLQPPSRFASPTGSGAVDVETPFTPHAMEELQQPRSPIQNTQEQAGKPQQQHQQPAQPPPQHQRKPAQPPPQQPLPQQALQQQERPPQPPSQQEHVKARDASEGLAFRGDSGIKKQLTGTRILVPQQNQPDALPPSTSLTTQLPDNALSSIEGDSKCNSMSQMPLNTSAVTAMPTATGGASGDVMTPSEPPARIDEAIVLRDLDQLKQKKKPFFKTGSAGSESPRENLLQSENDIQVDLS